MKREGRVSPAPRNSPASTVALLRDVISRLTRVSEAIEDEEYRLAEAIASDLIDDLWPHIERLESGVWL